MAQTLACLSVLTCLPVVQGKLTSQGKLLQQETFCVWEQDGGVLSRSKERRVFLFEQIIIFSELLRKGSNNPGYQFKNSIKVRLVDSGWRHGSVLDWFILGVMVLFLCVIRWVTWQCKTVWTVIPVSSCCGLVARRSASHCRHPPPASRWPGWRPSPPCWMPRTTSCQVSTFSNLLLKTSLNLWNIL